MTAHVFTPVASCQSSIPLSTVGPVGAVSESGGYAIAQGLLAILLLWGHSLRLGQPLWDFWWTKWLWDRVLSELFSFPLSVIIPLWFFILMYFLRMGNRPVDGHSSRHSLIPLTCTTTATTTGVQTSLTLPSTCCST
jgi:hypothetical protein